MISAMLIFLLFGLQFLVIPFIDYPYETPKVMASLIFITYLTILTLPQLFKNFNWLEKIKLWLFWGFCSLAIFHLLASLFPEHLLWGNVWRPQGTLVYFSLFLLFLIADKIPFSLIILSKLAAWTAIILLIISLMINPVSFRLIGPLGEANALGATVLFLLPLIMLIQTNLNQKIKIFSLVCCLILIFFSGSKSALLALVIQIMLIISLKYHSLKLPILFLTISLLVGAMIWPFLPRPIPSDKAFRFENRAEIWTISYQTAFYYPWGAGFGSVQDSVRQFGIDTLAFTQFQPIDHTHNLFLQWWLMAGLVGMILLLITIILAVRNFIVSQQWVWLIILSGLLIIQLFNPVSIVSLIQFWWLLGISFKLSITK